MIYSSISIPQHLRTDIIDQLAKISDSGIYISQAQLLSRCMEYWLAENHYHPTDRDRATLYQKSTDRHTILSVRWPKRQYNIMRFRGQMMRISVSFMFCLAYVKFIDRVMHEIMNGYAPPDDPEDNFAEIDHDHTEEIRTPYQSCVREKIIYLSPQPEPKPYFFWHTQ